jgi:hypothetical protein
MSDSELWGAFCGAERANDRELRGQGLRLGGAQKRRVAPIKASPQSRRVVAQIWSDRGVTGHFGAIEGQGSDRCGVVV